MAGAPPALPSKAVGDKITASDYINYLKAATDNLANPDRCYVYQTAGTSIAATFTLISFDTEAYDTNNLHSTVSNTSRITATVAGLYQVNFGILFPTATVATSLRGGMLRKNSAGSSAGGSLVAYTGWVHATSVNTVPTVATIDVQLNATDYVEMFGIDGSGPQTSVTGFGATYLQARWVALS